MSISATITVLAASELDWLGLSFLGVLLLVLVVLSGTFSGSETVLFALTPTQIQQQAASTNPFRRLAARLMERPRATLTTILIGNTAVNVFLFATSYVLFRDLAAQVGAWLNPVAGVASILLVVVFGEVVPKVLGVTLTLRLVPVAAAVVQVAGYVLRPAGYLLNALITEPLTRLFLGGPSRSGPARLSSDELKALLEMSRNRGVINPIEDAYLREIIDLSDLRVRDIMVPRVEVKVFDVAGPPEDLRALMRATHLTKVPAYRDTPDNIVGLIYAKMLFLERDKSLEELVMPVRFVPELITVEQLLIHFRKTKSQIAIAVDEYGGTAGLVTLEDAMEVIVGEIRDPEDSDAEPEIVQRGENEYEISGRLGIHFWGETFGVEQLPSRVATVGGLVVARLGRPARVGDAVTIGSVRLEVLRIKGRRIERLRVTPLGANGGNGGKAA